MLLTQSGITASLILILPSLVQARKYHDDPEYGDNGDMGGYDDGEKGYGMNGTDDQNEMGYTGTSTNAEENENENGIKWISPSPGDVLPSGQALTVTWHSPNPIYSPSFSLCTSTDPSTATGGDCGNENWPNVKDNGDGTFSAVVTMPVISQSIEKLYLSMNNPTNKGRTFNSPVFGVKGDSGVPNAYVASPVNPTTLVPTAMTTASASATYALAGDLDGTASTTATGADTLSMTATTATGSSGAVKPKATSARSTATTLPTAPDPSPTTPIAQTPLYPTIQAPLQATIPYAPLPLSTSTANADNMGLAASSHENKPNIKAIALPISICGLILIAALIFCARSRVFRKTGLGRDVENDWQSVIKEKAAASSLAASSSSLGSAGGVGNGVEVRERKDEVPVPTLGYRGRQYSHERDRERERFTEIPKVDYERRERAKAHRSGEYKSRRHRNRHRERREREESYHSERSRHSVRDVFDFERDRDKNDSREKEYYSTSRRSSGGIGGVYDRGYSYDRSSRPLEDPFEDTRTRPSSTRELYSSSHSSRRPSMPQKDSYCAPLSNPYDIQPSLSSVSHTRGERRPLPEPIIRSSTNSSTRSGVQHEEVMMPRQKTLPHLSGGLRDEHDGGYQYPKIRRERDREFESDTEAGWELAGEGRYTTGEEGMGELYESLRRAIQRG